MGHEISYIGGSLATAGTAIAAGVTFGQVDGLNKAVTNCAKFTGREFMCSTTRHVGEFTGLAVATAATGVATAVTLGQIDGLNKATVVCAKLTGKSICNVPRSVSIIPETIINDIFECSTSVRISTSRSSACITSGEIRYCHLMGEALDFLATLGNRALVMNRQAAHHHFLILYIAGGGDYLYVDKHNYRNVMDVQDKRGMDGNGNWIESELLETFPVRSGVTVGDVIEYISLDKFEMYDLLDNNCQKFCREVKNWLY